MEITSHEADDGLVVSLRGRLDTNTAPQLSAYLDGLEGAPDSFVFDLSELEYLSSAGLRVLLVAHKKAVVGGGGLTIRGASAGVREVLELTGFSALFTVE